MDNAKEKILDHYKNPRNNKTLEGEDVQTGKVENLSCGDIIEIFAKINSDGLIKELTFTGEGCSIALGSASILTEEFINKSLEDVQNISNEEWLQFLGLELNEARKKCALMSLNALNKIKQS